MGTRAPAAALSSTEEAASKGVPSTFPAAGRVAPRAHAEELCAAPQTECAPQARHSPRGPEMEVTWRMDENSTEKIRNELGINPISWCETPSPGTEADPGASDAAAAFEAAKVCPPPGSVVPAPSSNAVAAADRDLSADKPPWRAQCLPRPPPFVKPTPLPPVGGRSLEGRGRSGRCRSCSD